MATSSVTYSADGGLTWEPATLGVGGKWDISLGTGVSQFEVRVTTVADTVLEGTETYVLSAYATGQADLVEGTGTITDVAPPLVVSISGTPTVAEGGNLEYTDEVTLAKAMEGRRLL